MKKIVVGVAIGVMALIGVCFVACSKVVPADERVPEAGNWMRSARPRKSA